ncbi:MAG: DEAD/DEAH box helicase [Ferrimicrobium sp.]|nr:DEAD/DEAH box helicase [Ferrimicrobium sp.]
MEFLRTWEFRVFVEETSLSNIFDTLGVDAQIQERLAAIGITEPTAVQSQAIPASLAGHDLIAQAPTGSGKTFAFGVPLVSLLEGVRGRSAGPLGLILVPTRELAQQVQKALVSLAPRDFWVMAVYGGTPYGKQIAQLKRGIDVLVATPGRLMDLVDRRAVSLDAVTHVVLDEVDRMADMGFGPVVAEILGSLTSRRQTAFFSATLDAPVRSLVQRYLSDPTFITIEADEPKLEHRFVPASRYEKAGLVSDYALGHGPTIVFCNTRDQVDRLDDELADLGMEASAVHGGLSQRQRDAALRRFLTKRTQVLIATDVAARGIHVDEVALVLHYDLPNNFTDYLHRSGRTGRAGNTGVVISLVSDRDRSKARSIEHQLQTGEPSRDRGSYGAGRGGGGGARRPRRPAQQQYSRRSR